MESPIINAILKERSELALKIKAIDALLESYGVKPAVPARVEIFSASKALPAAEWQPAATAVKPTSKASQIRAEIDTLLDTFGTVHRKDILEHLIKQKLMGTEKNPMRALAAYLSGWGDRYVGDGKGNFSRVVSAEGAPAEAGAGKGSGGVFS